MHKHVIFFTKSDSFLNWNKVAMLYNTYPDNTLYIVH